MIGAGALTRPKKPGSNHRPTSCALCTSSVVNPPYGRLGVLITMRCNGHCRNCAKLCNLDELTGLSSQDADMDVGEIERVCEQIKNVAEHRGRDKLVQMICISGGEPTLHPLLPEFVEIFEKRLVKTKIAASVRVLTNGSNPTHPCSKYFLVFTPLRYKRGCHTAFFTDPAAGKKSVTYACCRNHRRNLIQVSKWGWCRCCGSLGYIRMIGADNALVSTLPLHESEWPGMDNVCAVCAFGNGGQLEKSLGQPFAERFIQEANLNRAGRQLRTRLA